MMRVEYVVSFEKPVRLEDHWPTDFMGGVCHILAKNGKANGLSIVFSGEPVSLAPNVEKKTEGRVRFAVTERDTLLPLVSARLKGALSYLKCYFNIDVLIDEIEATYDAETREEAASIAMNKVKFGKVEHTVPLSFDYLTRAIMAAEHSAPEFEATLLTAARSARLDERYVDSFRYSFLLIEALYGNGKFKADQLKDEMKASDELNALIDAALKEPLRGTGARTCDTSKLLSSSPTASAVIDHIVNKRGFYFHGNLKRKDAWKPHEQQEAEVLADLALLIAMQIAHEAAKPMFGPELEKRHFEQAVRVGAIMTLSIHFVYREPDDSKPREQTIAVRIPGTKMTRKMAMFAAKQFLADFEHNSPGGDLIKVHCTVNDTAQSVFQMTFSGEEPATES